jgi:hypothetical protein
VKMMNAFEQLCWVTAEERRSRLPGDELVPHPKRSFTHATTIYAPPQAVWPWIIQMGSGRAGWYSYDHIDKGAVPSARRIIPELQHIAVGDVMPWLPGAKDGFIVSEVIPERALVFVEPLELGEERSAAASSSSVPSDLRASEALILEGMDHGRTRLIARSRISRDWLAPQGARAIIPGKPKYLIERIYGLLAKMPWPLVLLVAGFGHYLMESRMLRGIKRRAERSWIAERTNAKE